MGGCALTPTNCNPILPPVNTLRFLAVLLSLLLLQACATRPTAESSRTTRPADGSEQLVLAALGFLDTAYRAGGNNADEGFDCSSFTRHLFDITLDMRLPRRAEEQARDARLAVVDDGPLLPGDLVFFHTLQQAFSHVGLYIGDGRFIHAPRTGAQIRIESMQTPYWRQRFNGARRSAAAKPDLRQFTE